MATLNDFSPSTHTILVVDDEDIVRIALRVSLEREGYQVITHSNPVEALEAVNGRAFSAIITDQQMPQMTGLDFLTRAKQIQPDATRILITAVLSLDTVVDAINRGEIYRFIVKPWLREELVVTMRNAAQRFELLCKNRQLQSDTLATNEQLRNTNRALEAQVAKVAEHSQQLETLNRALAENLQRSIELCLHTLETFYPTLGAQARRVHHLSRTMAESLQLSDEQCRVLEISAWLHAIGLVGIPRALIKRWQENPGGLQESERALVEQHPILGAELAQFIDSLSEVGTTIRSHRERFDGRGFPDGLRRNQIPWLARLLSVAVAYSESRLSPEDSVRQMQQDSGTAHDPEAVRALLNAIPLTTIATKRREVPLTDLRPGMVLATSVHGGNGLLLVPEGQPLTEVYITKLRNHHRVTPIAQSFTIYC